MARKAAASAPSPGLDRRRIGERLDASLAGLQELRLLRERHRETVRRLLEGREEEEEEEGEMEEEEEEEEEETSGEPGSKPPEGLQHPAGATGPPEQLSLSPSHGWRAGFYDVSDSTSCSLSNSCTSVYSECPSSSRWSMQSLTQLPRPISHRNRPRSTDDAAVCFGELRSQRMLLSGREVHPGEAGGALRRCRVSQRPVSTGDLITLRRFLSADAGGGPSPSSPGSWLPPGPPDRKYRCDLVSRHGAEVYHYPSPLHAVALQSPLFTACSARAYPLGLPPPREAGAAGEGIPEAQEPPEAYRGRLDKYISGLVLRSRCRPLPGRSELACRAKSLSLSSVYSQSSSASGGALASLPAAGWKLRRRISTCCPSSDKAPRSPGEAQACGAYSEIGQHPPGPSEAPLYRGRHLHRELVKCPSAQADSWEPRPGRDSTARSLSEAHLDSAPVDAGASPGCSGATRGRQRKWASVLEIAGRCGHRRPGLLSQAQAFLSRRQRPCPSGPPASPRLGRAQEAGADTLPRLGGAPLEGRFHRSKSFKELRKKVQLSIRPWSLKVNNSSK
ncbi:dapper homolog 2-like [Chiloscyllium plagiosum]|uniref:dapper homolog 2-like n=1 Tax=Chiloscyllium plagiosum TaxID=36176 RepID=UPI001CB7F819|nr:dapper homolog 2-like [Chiloscyllium plagiosum]